LRAESGPTALEALRELAVRGDRVAALLADHRMPEMNGIEFLEQAMDVFPEARRMLLTAYADTEAAIQAINERAATGGQAGQSSRIENYLGLLAGIFGAQHACRASDQCRKFDVEILTANDVVGVAERGASRIVRQLENIVVRTCTEVAGASGRDHLERVAS
jgi:CheY-like chemotaxis protein